MKALIRVPPGPKEVKSNLKPLFEQGQVNLCGQCSAISQGSILDETLLPNRVNSTVNLSKKLNPPKS